MAFTAARQVLALGAVVVCLLMSPASAAAQDENCGVRVDLPHPSRKNPAQVHTRVESFCGLVPMDSNQVSATAYRMRWFGWERMVTKSDGPRVTGRLRMTVAVDCEPGTQYRWRTEARGVATIAGRTYVATSYQQNDSPITCEQ